MSRLARTVRAWEAEILAFHATGGCSNGPTEAVNLLIKKVKRVGHGFRNFANYRLRLLLHCGVSWPTHPTARLRGRSPHLAAQSRTRNAPSADRIVCRGRATSGSRRHECPSWMVVSRRSGESRPPRWAARLQARVGSGSASPPRFEPTVLASPRSLSQFGLARLVSAGRRARCCHAEGAPVGAIGPNFGGTLDRCRSVPGSATPGESPPGRGSHSWSASPATAAPLLHCGLSWQTHRTTRMRGRSPRFVA